MTDLRNKNKKIMHISSTICCATDQSNASGTTGTFNVKYIENNAKSTFCDTNQYKTNNI